MLAPEYVDDRVDPQDVMDVEVDEVPPGNHNIVSAVVSEPIREEQVVLGSPVIIPPPDTPDLDIGPSPVPSQCSGKRGPDDPESLFEPSSLSEIRGITESPSDIDHVKRRRVGHSGRDSSPPPPRLRCGIPILLMLGWRVTHPPRPLLLFLLLLMRRGRKRVNPLTPPTLAL